MGETTFIDKIIQAILDPILKAMSFLLRFILSSQILAFFIFVVFMNLLGYILMKKDKSFAQDDKRRVRESTLLLVAICGGSVGMYIGMYKFKHKTLHKKFSIGIPIIMTIQIAIVTYALCNWLFL